MSGRVKRVSLSTVMGALAGVLMIPSAMAQSSFSDATVQNLVSGAAPVAGSLGPGDFTLTDGTYFESWEIALSVPSLLEVSLFSPDFDTYLALALPDNTIIGVNDDCTPGDLSRSCLEDIPAIPGTYYVVVNAYSPGEAGAYTLSMNATPIPEPVSGWLLLSGGLLLMRRRR